MSSIMKSILYFFVNLKAQDRLAGNSSPRARAGYQVRF